MMSSDFAPSHDQVQRWMQAVIMHPDGAAAGLASAAARQEIPVDREQLGDVVCRSRNLTSLERLQIYANAYLARLVECLHEEYPALLHLLGQASFDSFAVAYLQSYPSTSYTLADLSQAFPRFLQETRPDTATDGEESSDDGALQWVDFLIDLATVERTYSEVFDGPGLEGAAPLTPADLATVRPDDWERTKLLINPSLRLLTVQFPVHEYISAVRQGRTAEIPPPVVTHLVIFRRDFTVRRCPATAREYAILAALLQGDPLGTALEKGFDLEHPDPLPDEEALREWFRSWTAATYFSGIATPTAG